MECRANCGACCTAPSINFPYYGMPDGKPAGVVCVHLDNESKRCGIWMSEHYPLTCKNFSAEPSVCGDSAEEAICLIDALELMTKA